MLQIFYHNKKFSKKKTEKKILFISDERESFLVAVKYS